jgi:hypothetical protein
MGVLRAVCTLGLRKSSASRVVVTVNEYHLREVRAEGAKSRSSNVVAILTLCVVSEVFTEEEETVER